MRKSKTVLFPKQERQLETLGQNIKLARLRRALSAEQIAERAGIARSTLSKLENGNDGVSIGTLLKVFFVLGLDHEIVKLASDDPLGRELQDSKLLRNLNANQGYGKK